MLMPPPVQMSVQMVMDMPVMVPVYMMLYMPVYMMMMVPDMVMPMNTVHMPLVPMMVAQMVQGVLASDMTALVMRTPYMMDSPVMPDHSCLPPWIARCVVVQV